MHSLPIFVRMRGRKVVVIGDGEAAIAKRRLVERAGAVIVSEEAAAESMLAFVALDDAEIAAATAVRLRLHGLLVNVVDRPDLCDFTTPSIVDRAPVIVAVGTGGASAGLAKQVRLRIETLLPPGLGLLAHSLDKARLAIRSRFPDPRGRRAALDAAMAPGGLLDPLGADPARAVANWMAGEAQAPLPLREETLRLSSTDPDDLTLRQARLLGEADVVIHDAGVPDTILRRARADAIMATAGETGGLPTAGLIVTLTLV